MPDCVWFDRFDKTFEKYRTRYPEMSEQELITQTIFYHLGGVMGFFKGYIYRGEDLPVKQVKNVSHSFDLLLKWHLAKQGTKEVIKKLEDGEL